MQWLVKCLDQLILHLNLSYLLLQSCRMFVLKTAGSNNTQTMTSSPPHKEHLYRPANTPFSSYPLSLSLSLSFPSSHNHAQRANLYSTAKGTANYRIIPCIKSSQRFAATHLINTFIKEEANTALLSDQCTLAREQTGNVFCLNVRMLEC